METKSLLTALAGAAVLAACASTTLDGKANVPAGCDDPSNPSHMCRVTIKVNSCTQGQGSITATPDVRHVPRGTWVIQWTLATPGHEFADDGIEFKKDKNPGGIFTKRGRTAAATFTWVDNNTAAGGPYPYSVHILKNGAECASYDPDVSND